MQITNNDNTAVLIILAMLGVFLAVGTFIIYSIRNQNKLLRQRQEFQKAQLAHQKELLKATIESQENERKRIGQDLHDDVGTTISGLRLLIEMFKPAHPDDDNLKEFTQTSKSIIDKIVKDVRNISHNLSPTTLRYYGLPAAITEHCTIINQSGKLSITFDNQAEAELQALHITVATALYRVLEELLNNTIKHSGANRATIGIKKLENNIVINYNDNGKGITISHDIFKKGMGMQNIESRLLNIDAIYSIQPYNGQGFGIEITYPLHLNPVTAAPNG
ncbi:MULTISPECIES: sensor histidine kinase [unclassified Mucilaginibacter]|uniref:sensor histidine kinase n=1 Tax=unclassified Mucilaginibacter TaxID=2617802 RepID=UPI000964939C|nr:MULTISPECIES: histidine kinase [unclassified Mucilaginibacter]OJW13837.1 MAG: hypothetical protein BGO48_03705 [Mucilaginibacter sp. 44-25]PLW90953.1 MAG: hypothetical protein C0154_03750 [Mucilaginibacter sp.]PMP66366.1 MAG: hypothetical protein C0191_00825 [Mucilaginibacter sp.]HEK21082.1 hypothetical protein [Bacteroidota bacterium]